jgi:hypothetical protein
MVTILVIINIVFKKLYRKNINIKKSPLNQNYPFSLHLSLLKEGEVEGGRHRRTTHNPPSIR